MSGSAGLMCLLQVSSGRLSPARRRAIPMTSGLLALGLCLILVCANASEAKTTASDQTTTTTHHHKSKKKTTTVEVKSTSHKSQEASSGRSTHHRHVSEETVSHKVSHGRRHHNLTAQTHEEDRRAGESSSRHGRHHRHNELGKQNERLTGKKSHGYEPGKPSHKESEAEEALEPPSIRVDSESMMRGYSRYDDGVNKRLNGDLAGSISALQEARQIFHEHALQESPMETFAALELGRSADEAGNYRLARRTYEDLKATSPSSLLVRLKLARLEAKNGEIFDALREAREAVTLEPNSAEAHLMLSLILDRSGSAMEAIVEKQRAAELAGGHLQPL